jgi:hypothetical protein
MLLRELRIPMHFMADSAGIWDEVRNSFYWDQENLSGKTAVIDRDLPVVIMGKAQ